MGGEGANAKIPADFVQIPGFHGNQGVWRRLPLDLPPRADHVIDRRLEFARQQHGPRLHSLKIALRQVIRQPGDMVHVAMGYAHDVAGEGKMRRPPHVKADVQLRHLRDGFFARHAIADDRIHAQGNPGELLHKERLFDHAAASVGEAGGFVSGRRRGYCATTVSDRAVQQPCGKNLAGVRRFAISFGNGADEPNASPNVTITAAWLQ